MAEEKRENRSNISENELGKKDTNTLLVDENNQTIDIYDLLEQNMTDGAVIKINNLIENSEVTQEIVAEKYAEVAGNITNKDLALLALDSVFMDLALSVTEKPNGRVIDLSTGKLDQQLSEEQAEALGISDSEVSYASVSKEEIVRASIEKSLDKYRERLEAKREATSRMNQKTEYNELNAFSSKAYRDALEAYSNRHAFSERKREKEKEAYTKRGYDETTSEIIVDAYEDVAKTDPVLMMMVKLAEKVESSKGTHRFNVEINRLNKFLEQNPKYKDIYPQIIDESRNVRQEYKDQQKDYQNKLGFSEFFNKTKNLTEETIALLGKEHKKELATYFMASFGQLAPKSPLQKQIIENMKLVFPEFADIAKDEGGFDVPKLCEFLEQTLELKKPIDETKLKKLSAACQDEVFVKRYHEQRANDRIEAKEESEKNGDRISENEVDIMFARDAVEMHVDINEALRDDNDKNEEEKYFRSSQILKFSDRDSNILKRTYRQFNSMAWIDEKQTAVKLNFLSLVTLKRNLEKYSKNSPFYAQKLEEVESRIDAMKGSNPEVDFDQYLGARGSIADKYKKEIDSYETSKITEKVLFDFIADEDVVRSRADYDKLTKEDKQEYLLNTMALFKTTKNMNSTLAKFIARRLEIIDPGENNMVSLAKNANGEVMPKINRDKLLEEYNKTSSHRFESFEELLTYTKVKKMEYISDKLDEYSSLREEDFFKLTSTSVKDRSFEIENIRMDFNLRKRQESSIGEQTQTATTVTESKTQSEVVTEQNQSTTVAKSETEARNGQIQSATVEKSGTEARNEQNQKTEESVNEENEIYGSNNENNTVSQENEKALTVTEKPSFFSKIKDFFSMLTNLAQRPKETYSNNQRDNSMSNYSNASFVPQVEVNTLEAVDSLKSKKENEQQVQKPAKEADER